MRGFALALLVVFLAAGSSAAQQPRLSLAPTFGYVAIGDLFEHTVEYDGVDGNTLRSSERLSAEPARSFGLSASYRLSGGWWLQAEFGLGSAEVEFRDVDAASETREYGDADVVSYGASVLRHVALGSGGPVLGFGLGATLHRMDIDNPRSCAPPSTGTVSCTGDGRWATGYDVPGVSGKLYLQQSVVGRLGVRAGAAHSIGRTDTSHMWADMLPEYDHLEAPKSQRVHVTSWTAAITIGL